MSYFNCRLLLGAPYEAAVHALDRVASGDAITLTSIKERCRNWLASEAFREWHSDFLGSYWHEKWSELIDNLSDNASPEAAKKISEVFIASACMPEFQGSYSCNRVVSPNLVPLSDYDGALYGVLADTSRWFDQLFLERLMRPEKYGVGAAMIILNHVDLSRLQVVIAEVADDKCKRVLVPEACFCARAQLAFLVMRCLSLEDGLLAVEDTGD
jgi:hypothetical protein